MNDKLFFILALLCDKHQSLNTKFTDRRILSKEIRTLGLKSNRISMTIYVGFAYNAHKWSNSSQY